QEANNVLVGGVDEITDISHAILTRFGLYKRKPVSNLDLFNTPSRGTIAGEGAAFFLLTNEASPANYAQLQSLHTFYKPRDIKETASQISTFLERASVLPDKIDLLITGKNGDEANDRVY